jgi:hypothetical protein
MMHDSIPSRKVATSERPETPDKLPLQETAAGDGQRDLRSPASQQPVTRCKAAAMSETLHFRAAAGNKLAEPDASAQSTNGIE